MYICTYEYDGKKTVGILSRDKLYISPICNVVDRGILDINDVINQYNDKVKLLSNKFDKYIGEQIPLNKVKICAPIEHPKRDIICLGKNYIDHALEVKDSIVNTKDIPEYPIYFTKRADPAIGTGDIIHSHEELTNQIDYEVELAVIIGKNGRDIPKEQAQDYIFGYTIINDVSARDIQKKHEQWFRGKSLATFCPMGPFIVTKDEIPFPVTLDISSKVNNHPRQSSNTKHMIFNISHIISDISRGMELKAGDIIITGTPSGVGLGFKPPRFLKKGDKIECTIEKIGTLVNYIQ
ncbi:MAG: fumarylacetoacetate hydrolase family protein [Vallitalea sp.]|jgi:2-keto-4-pentenoate hydratase/2-oxohepta-3-ene-1,7-dioic acid hydratase in catechol pathway|nr:fumarylacetoacetate hydrolase family protein [Vallitalea sp.]